MAKYVKCPRCELNYMDPRQEMCDICRTELGEPLESFIDDDEEMVLCPICKRNLIGIDDEMCEECRLSRETAADVDLTDDEWRVFLEDEPAPEEETAEIPLEELQDSEFAEDFDDEEEEFETYKAVDDFEAVDIEDYDENAYFDEEENEEEEEDEDEDEV